MNNEIDEINKKNYRIIQQNIFNYKSYNTLILFLFIILIYYLN